MGLITNLGGGGGASAPESTVVGTGSYTVPALKFAVVSASATSGGGASVSNTTNLDSYTTFNNVTTIGSADSNSNIATLKSGDTITTSISNPSGSSSYIYTSQATAYKIRETVGVAKVNVNGTTLVSAYSKATVSARITYSILSGSAIAYLTTSHSGEASWVASIYPV